MNMTYQLMILDAYMYLVHNILPNPWYMSLWSNIF